MYYSDAWCFDVPNYWWVVKNIITIMHHPTIKRHIWRAIWIPFWWFFTNYCGKMYADVFQEIYLDSSIILDVQEPGMEPSTYYENFLFGWRCGILFYVNDNGVQYACSISTLELICLYGVTTKHVEINPEILFSMEINLNALLPHSLPYEFG